MAFAWNKRCIHGAGGEKAVRNHYSPRSFLRQVPNSLLKEFFERRGLLSDIYWYLQRETDVDFVYAAWQRVPQPTLGEIETCFRAIHEMACEAGIKSLIEEGRFHGVDIANELESRDGFHHKAMWAFLRHERIFYVASILNYADALNRRYWFKRHDMPRKPPIVYEQALCSLGSAMSEYYRLHEGRGHRCTVETYLRANRYQYFFAYPDDYTDTYIGHGDDGKFIRRPQKKAFEVVFVYDPVDGTLDLHAQGDKQLRTDLQLIFCRTILAEDIGPERPRTRTYELNGLLRRDFGFPTDPEDGIEQVRVRKLRLSDTGNASRRVTLEADPKGPAHDIYDLIEQRLNNPSELAFVFNVTQATLQICFAATATNRSRVLEFDVSYPDSSNLKNKRESDRLIGEKYLNRWGIERA